LKILVMSSKQVNYILCVATVITLVILALGTYVSANANRLLPIYSVENNKKQVAITFDAAWDDSGLDDIMTVLKKYDAPSTVFAVGEWVDKYPDAVKKLDEAGHLMANHSNKHIHLNKMNAEQFREDVQNCNKRIEAITGKPVTLYRGPYGEYNNMSVSAIKNMNMYYVQWDCDSLDWKPDYTVDMITKAALKNVQSGSIILLHIGAKHTAAALENILVQLEKEGYSFVTVDKLILKDNYTIDHTGRQIKKGSL